MEGSAVSIVNHVLQYMQLKYIVHPSTLSVSRSSDIIRDTCKPTGIFTDEGICNGILEKKKKYELNYAFAIEPFIECFSSTARTHCTTVFLRSWTRA